MEGRRKSGVEGPEEKDRLLATEKKEKAPTPGRHSRKPWETPKLTYVGNVADIVRGGAGKLSEPGGDPGESRGKPRGSG